MSGQWDGGGGAAALLSTGLGRFRYRQYVLGGPSAMFSFASKMLNTLIGDQPESQSPQQETQMHQPVFRPVRAPGTGPRGPLQQRYPSPGPSGPPGPRMDFRPRGLTRPQSGPSHMIRTAAPVASGTFSSHSIFSFTVSKSCCTMVTLLYSL